MLMAAYRPRCPILAVTRVPQTARQLHLYRGVFPLLFPGERNADWTEDMDQRINFAMEVRREQSQPIRPSSSWLGVCLEWRPLPVIHDPLTLTVAIWVHVGPG